MRNRNEIMAEHKRDYVGSSKLILEVLIDIRDKLDAHQKDGE